MDQENKPGVSSIGFVECSSIGRGIEAVDSMMKTAEVELLMTTIIPRGKYLIMIGGTVANVESSMKAGMNLAEGFVLESFIIPNVHPDLPPAIRGRVKVREIEAIGVLETKEVAPAIYAADTAVKSASIRLIEARNQPGGKGLVVLTGDVGAVRSAISAGAATIRREGMLIAEIVIPHAHQALLRTLDAG